MGMATVRMLMHRSSQRLLMLQYCLTRQLVQSPLKLLDEPQTALAYLLFCISMKGAVKKNGIS